MAGHHGIALVASCVLNLLEEGRIRNKFTDLRVSPTRYIQFSFLPFIAKLRLNVNLDRVGKVLVAIVTED